MTLKDQILEANRAYRLGRPMMSDQEFDDLCEAYEKTVTPEEYAVFRDSLHEETGKVKHPYIMGSLDKLKSDDAWEAIKWLDSLPNEEIHISAKIDGISCRLHYNGNGELVSGTTRGDGTAGIDCTEKVKMVGNGIPNVIDNPTHQEIDIRGELVIKDAEFADISSQFANPRNACAGIFNQKYPDADLLAHVSFIAYEVMGGQMGKNDQFIWLKDRGFTTPWYRVTKPAVYNEPFIQELVKDAENSYGYPTDGLVISSVNYKAESRYRPFKQKAFKINAQSTYSTITGVEWGDPSKDGRMSPVAIIVPVEVSGSTISRITLNNLDWIAKMNVKIGSTIKVVKAGDVIPKVGEVIGGNESIVPPKVCPHCGAPVVVEGPHAVCTNKNCSSRTLETVFAFIKNLGIKRVAKDLLRSWSIMTIDDLLNFTPNPRYKMQVYLAKELADKLGRINDTDLLCAIPFKDLAETTLRKLADYYGIDNIINQQVDLNKPFPAGIGLSTVSGFMDQLADRMEIFNKVKSDPRTQVSLPTAPIVAAPVNVTATNSVTSNNTNQTGGNTTMSNNTEEYYNGSVCFTGALNTMTRTEASAKARAAGFEVKSSVTAGLDYLVTNNPDSGSTKARKAAQYGTRIITEQEFLMLI